METAQTKNSFEEIITGEAIVLVDFFAEWCGPCKMVKPILENLKSELGASIKILKVDVDKNESKAQEFKIQSVPTLILFVKGKAVWRHSGVVPLTELKNLITTFQH